MAKINANRGGKKKPVATEPKPDPKQPTAFSTLEDIISGRQQSPVDVKNLAHIFMERIGGPNGFVDKVLEEYEGSAMGSLARSRFFDIMLKLFQLATPKEREDYSELTEDDLKHVLKKHIAPSQDAQLQWVDHVCI